MRSDRSLNIDSGKILFASLKSNPKLQAITFKRQMINHTKTGWVGFFDILGYINLLERNEPESIAEEVIPILTGAKTALLEDINFLFTQLHGSEKDIPENVKNIIASLQSIVFSDTILLTMPVQAESNYQEDIACFIFQMACSGVQTDLFRAGLPLRGAIDYGKYFVQDSCFAGRPIVNSYHLCQQLELSACVLSDEACKHFRSLPFNSFKNPDYVKNLWVDEYLVAMKSGERHLLAIKAPVPKNKIDIRDQVMEAFWGHRKDVSQSALKKALNTEQWLRYLSLKKDKPDQSF